MKIYSCQIEVMVRPWFRKSRAKIVHECWSAESISELFRQLKEHYDGKHWKLLNFEVLSNA